MGCIIGYIWTHLSCVCIYPVNQCSHFDYRANICWSLRLRFNVPVSHYLFVHMDVMWCNTEEPFHRRTEKYLTILFQMSPSWDKWSPPHFIFTSIVHWVLQLTIMHFSPASPRMSHPSPYSAWPAAQCAVSPAPLWAPPGLFVMCLGWTSALTYSNQSQSRILAKLHMKAGIFKGSLSAKYDKL